MKVSESFTCNEVLGFKFGYHPFAKPTMFSHVYFVDGLLIDTGHSLVQKEVLSAIKQLDVEQVYVTHHHEDHTGNAAKIREIQTCEIYASSLCCQMMKAPPQIGLAQKITWGDRKPIHGLTPKDDSIDTPNYHFQLIPIPGHAPDMVALYEPERKWLFSADLYINSYIDYYIEDESMADQILSTRKILQLDFNELFCGHRPKLKNGKESLTKKLHFLESFFENVSSLHAKGHSPKEIFRQMKLKENRFVAFLSGGYLSKMNMVKSVIRDVEMGADATI